MANGFDDIRGLGEEIFDYLKLRWASLRLGTVDRLSTAAAGAIGKIIGFAVIFFGVVFLMFALALWLGEILGHLSLGFLIAGGVFLLVGAIFLYFGRKMFAGTMVRNFVKLFFTDNDYRHGK